jgi:hypothetical protein
MHVSSQLKTGNPCCLVVFQGWEQYSIGAFDAIPTPHLQQALNLKAGACPQQLQVPCQLSGQMRAFCLACGPARSSADATGLTPSRLASCPAGVVTSGNSLDYTAEDMERMVAHEAAVKVGCLPAGHGQNARHSQVQVGSGASLAVLTCCRTRLWPDKAGA